MNELQNIKEKCIEIISNPDVINDLFCEYSNVQELYRITSNLEITITPKNVIDMLTKWQQHVLTSQDLIKWAAFVTISDAYDTEENVGDYLYFSPLWGILGQISTPEIDGPMTLERSNEYIKELSKL